MKCTRKQLDQMITKHRETLKPFDAHRRRATIIQWMPPGMVPVIERDSRGVLDVNYHLIEALETPK